MKKINLILTALFLILFSFAGRTQTTLYMESFSENPNSVSGTSDEGHAYAWTSQMTQTPGNKKHGGYVESGNLKFEDTDYAVGLNVWNTVPITVTGYDNLTLTIPYAYTNHQGQNDNLHVDYNLDGGTWTSALNMLIPSNPGGSGTLSFPIVLPLGITSLDLRITVNNTENNEVVLFDYIQVTGVKDVTPPVAVCQPVTIQLNALGVASANAAQVNNGSTDAGTGIASLALSKTSFSCAEVGPNSVTLTVTDARGNYATCQSTVTVEDKIAPVIVGCPGNISKSNDPGVCGAKVTWSPITVTDNCSAILTYSHHSGDVFPKGVTTVTVTATDPSGNQATPCTFTVTITDDEKPVPFKPTNVTVENDPGLCGAMLYRSENFTGSFDPLNWTLKANGGNGWVEEISAPTTIVLFGSNNSSNTSTNTEYGIQIPSTGILKFNWDYITTDYNADPNILWGPTFDPFGYIINGVFTQLSNNASSTHQTGSITLTLNEGDSFAFVVKTVDNRFGYASSAMVDFSFASLNLSATDNCPGVTVISDWVPGTKFPVGVTTINIKATDTAGNIGTTSYTVTVNDKEKPTITCPANINITTDPAVCQALVVLETPTANDNCAVASVVGRINNVVVSGSYIFPKGITKVIWTATDIHGNVNTCDQIVTVVDDEAPVNKACNLTFIVEMKQVTSGTTTVWRGNLPQAKIKALIYDNCDVIGGKLNVAFSQTIFTPQSWGTNSVTVTAKDAAGNVNSCFITVIVRYPLKAGEVGPKADNDEDFVNVENTAINIYPNPTKGRLTIQMGALNNPNVSAVVYNMAGSVVMKKNFSTEGQFEVDLTGLVNGMYTLKLTADGVDTVHKIVLKDR